MSIIGAERQRGPSCQPAKEYMPVMTHSICALLNNRIVFDMIHDDVRLQCIECLYLTTIRNSTYCSINTYHLKYTISVIRVKMDVHKGVGMCITYTHISTKGNVDVV